MTRANSTQRKAANYNCKVVPLQFESRGNSRKAWEKSKFSFNEGKEKHRQTDRKIKAENCHTSWQGQLLIERVAGAAGTEWVEREGNEERACCFLLRMMWQRQVKILAKQNLIAICKAQKVSSFSAPHLHSSPHLFLPCLLWINDNVWQGKQHTLSPLCDSLPYATDTDTVPSCPLPTDWARVIAHATPTTLSAFTPSPFLSPSSLSLLTRTVCVSRFVCSLSVNLISFNALGLFAQLAVALAEVEGMAKGGTGAASAATEATLFVIKCEKYENSETKHAALHWLPQASHARTTHTLIHIDPSARLACPATPHLLPRRVTHNLPPLERGLISVFTLIAAPTRFAYNGLPLTAWQRLFVSCKSKGCSGN